MQQVYSEHHLTQAHHHGLVAGTLIGSLAVTTLIAVSVVISNPGLILHPFSFTSALTKPQTSQTSQTGVGVTEVTKQTQQTTSGAGAKSVTNLSL